MKCLLFFAMNLLLSTIAVAYDYHDASESDTCPICSMHSFLSSAVGQASVVPQIDRISKEDHESDSSNTWEEYL
jgi:hypothetical protein